MKKFKENDIVVFSKLTLLREDLIDTWKIRFEENTWKAVVIGSDHIQSYFRLGTGEAFYFYNSDNAILGAINVKF